MKLHSGWRNLGKGRVKIRRAAVLDERRRLSFGQGPGKGCHLSGKQSSKHLVRDYGKRYTSSLKPTIFFESRRRRPKASGGPRARVPSRGEEDAVRWKARCRPGTQQVRSRAGTTASAGYRVHGTGDVSVMKNRAQMLRRGVGSTVPVHYSNLGVWQP